MYRAGQLHLDELVTAIYPMSDIERGYADLLAGTIIRGVLSFE